MRQLSVEDVRKATLKLRAENPPARDHYVARVHPGWIEAAQKNPEGPEMAFLFYLAEINHLYFDPNSDPFAEAQRSWLDWKEDDIRNEIAPWPAKARSET